MCLRLAALVLLRVVSSELTTSSTSMSVASVAAGGSAVAEPAGMGPEWPVGWCTNFTLGFPVALALGAAGGAARGLLGLAFPGGAGPAFSEGSPHFLHPLWSAVWEWCSAKHKEQCQYMGISGFTQAGGPPVVAGLAAAGCIFCSSGSAKATLLGKVLMAEDSREGKSSSVYPFARRRRRCLLDHTVV